MKYIDELKKGDLEGKKVLLRVDFNSPLLPTISPDSVAIEDPRQSRDDQLPAKIDSFKIKASIETIDYLLNNGATIVMLSHVDPPLDSFFSIIDQIAKVLGHDVGFVSLSDFLNSKLQTLPIPSRILDKVGTNSKLILVDNVRQDPREVQNDERLSRDLAVGFDLFVNDAFASMHRNHASVAGVAKFLPSYAGILVRKEVENLQQAVDAPREGKVLVMGGAKLSTKLPVIKNFLDKAEKILVGGALANDFFQAQNIKIGASLVDDTAVDVQDEKIILPTDVVVSTDKSGNATVSVLPVQDLQADELILDIGEKTRDNFVAIIKQAKMVIWNGPMGLAEVSQFAEGTFAVANAIAGVPRSIIGGGDTIAVLRPEIRDRYSFLSTGGGAMLEFLAGNKLSGLEALGYYE